MTYKELLELAANAAGIEHEGWVEDYDDGRGGTGPGLLTWSPTTGVYVWNPLTDDGDALRLAVKLKMHFYTGYKKISAEILSDSDEPSIFITMHNFDGDTLAATRSAIVRAAAEIGRTMK